MKDTWEVIRHSGRMREMANGQRIADIRTVAENKVSWDASDAEKDKAEDKARQAFDDVAGVLLQGWVALKKNGIVIDRKLPPCVELMVSK